MMTELAVVIVQRSSSTYLGFVTSMLCTTGRKYLVSL